MEGPSFPAVTPKYRLCPKPASCIAGGKMGARWWLLAAIAIHASGSQAVGIESLVGMTSLGHVPTPQPIMLEGLRPALTGSGQSGPSTE